jgi:hypothetical protein
LNKNKIEPPPLRYLISNTLVFIEPIITPAFILLLLLLSKDVLDGNDLTILYMVQGFSSFFSVLLINSSIAGYRVEKKIFIALFLGTGLLFLVYHGTTDIRWAIFIILYYVLNFLRDIFKADHNNLALVLLSPFHALLFLFNSYYIILIVISLALFIKELNKVILVFFKERKKVLVSDGLNISILSFFQSHNAYFVNYFLSSYVFSADLYIVTQKITALAYMPHSLMTGFVDKFFISRSFIGGSDYFYAYLAKLATVLLIIVSLFYVFIWGDNFIDPVLMVCFFSVAIARTFTGFKIKILLLNGYKNYILKVESLLFIIEVIMIFLAWWYQSYFLGTLLFLVLSARHVIFYIKVKNSEKN